MIPKIIHFCWLSSDEYPDSIKRYMDSWKKKLPDYEFIHWDTKRFKLNSNIWVKQAFESKKYAFAADYIRLYAVYNFGGIYMDTDIEVFKSFDDLLDQPYFIGTEGGGNIEAGVFGAEAKNPWVGECLKYYSGKTFINPDNSMNTETLPRIMMKQISKIRTVKELPIKNIVISKKILSDNKSVYLYPVDFFCAKEQGTGLIYKTKNTYCIHHFAMSWIPISNKILSNFKRFLIKIFGYKVIEKVIKILMLKELKNIFKVK